MRSALRRNIQPGGTAPEYGSPLPQEDVVGAPTPVRIVHGFTSILPSRSRLFFQRVYFAAMPRPIQKAAGVPFPFPVAVATLQAPQKQAIVLRSAGFAVYQHSGIAVDDVVEVERSRTATYFGFDLRIGNRGLTDFNTNNAPQPGLPVSLSAGPKSTTASLSPGAGQLYPFSGPITPQQPDSQFASYVRPGDEISAKVTVLREPNYDVRFFSVWLSGWLANEATLEKMLSMLSE